MTPVGPVVLFDRAIKHVVTGAMAYGTNNAIARFSTSFMFGTQAPRLAIFAGDSGWQRYVLSTLGIGVSFFLA